MSSSLPSTDNKYAIQIPQFTPDSGSIDDVFSVPPQSKSTAFRRPFSIAMAILFASSSSRSKCSNALQPQATFQKGPKTHKQRQMACVTSNRSWAASDTSYPPETVTGICIMYKQSEYGRWLVWLHHEPNQLAVSAVRLELCLEVLNFVEDCKKDKQSVRADP